MAGSTLTPLNDAERIALREVVAFLDDGIRDMLRFATTAAEVDAQVPRLRALAAIMRGLEDDALLIDDDVVAVLTDNHGQLRWMISDHRDALRRLARREPGVLEPGDEDYAAAAASTREELDGLLDEYAGSTSVLQRAGVA